MKHIVVVLVLLLIVSLSLWAKMPDNSGGIVDVVRDCGAPATPLADAYPTIQECLNRNPGKHIVFPKVGPSTSGGNASSVDYTFSHTLVMNGDGQWLDGTVSANWTGGVHLRFAAGIPAIRCHVTGCRISNLEIDGQSCSSAWRQELQGPGPDGIQIGSPSARVETTTVECFQRHGIYLAGDSTIWRHGAADTFRLDQVTATNNGADGIYAHGGDSNAGVAIHINVRGNLRYGIEDDSPLGNIWIGANALSGNAVAAFGGAGQRSLWIQPYIEIGQRTKFATGTLILGSNNDPSVQDYSAGSPQWFTTGPAATLFGQQGFALRNFADSQFLLNLRAGRTVDENEIIQFQGYDGGIRWQLGWSHGMDFALVDARSGKQAIWVRGGADYVNLTGMTLVPGSQPPCDQGHRFLFWSVAGSPGAKDTVQVCAKDAKGNYAWRVLY